MNKVTFLRIAVRYRQWHGYAFHCDNWFTRLRFRMKHPVLHARVAERVRILRSGRGYVDA